MNSTVKTVLFWLLIGVSALLLWTVVKGARDSQKDAELHVPQFMSELDQNNLQEFTVNGMEVRGKLRNNSLFHATVPANYFTPEVLKDLKAKGVDFKFTDANSGSLPLQLLGGDAWNRDQARDAQKQTEFALLFFPIRRRRTCFSIDHMLSTTSLADTLNN